MSTSDMKRIAEKSPRFKVRLAGIFFMLTMLTAVFTEFIVRGRLSSAGGIAADIVEVSGNVASALLAEGVVMLWLLVMGVNIQRWKEQASATRVRV